MRGAWRYLFLVGVAAVLAGCSDDGKGGKGGGGSTATAGATSGGGGAGGGSAAAGGPAVDRNSCDICDVAARCCFAAVMQDYCGAYSTAECLKKTDPAETIEYCRIQVDAAYNVEGCK